MCKARERGRENDQTDYAGCKESKCVLLCVLMKQVTKKTFLDQHVYNLCF